MRRGVWLVLALLVAGGLGWWAWPSPSPRAPAVQPTPRAAPRHELVPEPMGPAPVDLTLDQAQTRLDALDDRLGTLVQRVDRGRSCLNEDNLQQADSSLELCDTQSTRLRELMGGDFEANQGLVTESLGILYQRMDLLEELLDDWEARDCP